MRRIFRKQNKLIIFRLCLIFLTITGHSQWSQSQNPFEIKSRNYIDSTKVTSEGNREHQSELPGQTTFPAEQNRIDTTERTGALISPMVSPDTPLIHLDSGTSEEADSSILAISGGTITPKSSANRESSDLEVNKEILLKDNNELYNLDYGGISWWYYIYDLVLLLILLGAFLYDKKIFPPLRKAFMHENFLRFLYRDTYIRKPGLFVYLNLLFLLSLGFIIFRAAQYYDQASSFQDYLIIQGVIIFLFLIKHVALHLLSRLVDKSYEVKFYQYWMILSAGLIGLWMIPLALMISVLPFQFLYIALIIAGLSIVILLIYRQSKAMLQAKFFVFKHFFQIILYFCAIEIVPVVLLADILVHY